MFGIECLCQGVKMNAVADVRMADAGVSRRLVVVGLRDPRRIVVFPAI